MKKIKVTAVTHRIGRRVDRRGAGEMTALTTIPPDRGENVDL